MKPYVALFVVLAVLVPVEVLGMPKWSAGQFFMIKDKHYKAVSEAKASVFEGRVIKWLKGEFEDSPHIDGKSDAELLELVRAGIEDARRLQSPMREKDILDMVAVRAMTPELLENQAYFDLVMSDPEINHMQRTSYFLEPSGRKYAKTAEEFREIYRKRGRFRKGYY